MKRHRQFNKDIKYTPKSYNNLLPYDVVELLIARRDKTKVSDEVLADKIGIYAWNLEALLERRILPNESECKLIIDFLREVERC
ncbi:TPA: hypothetical protein VCS55_001618 [Streptococcus pyogenes]|uniref:hypothetical protein n=1 Tax=Streptococcus pyogenes TaxID=1314 RepID=UPI00044F9A81|nr:hypothetical protein [Streptococcus pyogenes]HEP6172693.1 hypothetical protein [Streptococcus pyogenes ABC020055614]HEP6188247.1 hypothetical protein [Streptococcus pyogenes ABC020038034]HEP6199673.1 hypothetical protein [Streptococcus pyogenes ABC020031035]HEP6203878.1 hypothetical protein [Streptococcus pyogenes ABC020034843]HEP6222501.1 hypothetical protein [Streptococcus pyogenes ABC020055881]HEP6225909.1 hypothetical protein [Streptococcus pyogenes ABC020054353]HEP6236080.1 hypotheti